MKRKVKKVFLFLLGLVLLPVVFSPLCIAEEYDRQDYETETEVEKLIPPQAKEFIQEQPYSIEELKDMTFAQLLELILSDFLEKLKAPFRLCAKICAVCILSALLKQFNGKNQLLQISSAMHAAIGITVFLLIGQPLLSLFGTVGETLEAIKTFMTLFIPTFSSVMVVCGQPAASVFYSTVFLSGITLIAQILMNIILPFVKIQLSLHIAGCVGALKLQAVSDFITKFIKWSLGFMATLFAAVLGFQTYLANGTDSIALRTGKLLVGNGIPIIGRAVSEAMGTVFSGLGMMKGSVGILGIVAIVLIFAPILTECICYYVSLYAAKAAANILQCERGEAILSGMCECVSLYMIIICFFTFLSILGVTAALAAGVKGV